MMTIRHRVLLALVTTGIVPLVALLLMTDFMIGSAIRQSEQEKVTSLNQAVGAHVGALMAGAAEDLKAMQTNRFLSDSGASLEDRLREMQRLVEVYDFISDVSMYDLDGFLLKSTTEDYPRYRDQSFDFKESVAHRELTFSRAYREVGKPGLFLSVYIPILQEGADEAEHVLVARLDYSRVVNLVHEVRPGENGRILLLDGWGNLLTASDEEVSLGKFDKNLTLEQWVGNPEGIYEDSGSARFMYRADVISPALTQVETPWVLISLLPEEEVKALLSRSQMGVALVALATLALAGGIGWLISLRLASPLVSLSDAATKVAAGDLSVRAEGKGSVETIQLASSFNQMVEELGEHREGLEQLVQSRTQSLRHSQLALEQTGARLQSAIDSTNNGFMVEDLDGQVAVVNRLFLHLLGIEEKQLASNAASEILKPFKSQGQISEGTYEDWERRREEQLTIDGEFMLHEPESRVLHVFSAPIRDRRGTLVGRVWNTQDLTEQRGLEDSLRQSQKMEAVGQLAGGVAHDFNNLLTGIMGNLSLVSLEMDKSRTNKACREHLGLALKAGERAAELVKQLLGFSRRSQMDLKPCDAKQVLGEVRDILRATVDRRIAIELDPEESSWKVMADLGLLSQVILNMGVNAKDAMPHGGRLLLSSSNCEISPEETQWHFDAAPGDYVRLSIEDDGEGIPDDIQKRIFEPFFTTKEPGKGTGLGLATSFGIIKQLGGWIEMDSREGEGTRFDIYLPRSAAAEAQPELPAPKSKLEEYSGGRRDRKETILLVDDEDVVRHVGRALLQKLGYRTLEAVDGLEALKTIEEQGDEIDMILLDLTMPNLSGKETFTRLRRDGINIPVLICSGYLVDVNEFAEDCGSCPEGFVQKPYRFEDMSDIIRATLDGRKDAA